MPTCQDCGAAHPLGAPCRGQFLDEDEAFATNPVRPGTVLANQWRVESRLGKGGMSSVFLAVDQTLSREVAIKVLAEELCQDGEWLARFDRETRRTAQMEHPNIVPVFATGRHGTRPFVVMKRLEGMPLSRYLRQVPLPLPLTEVRALMRQLCAALEHMHGQGVIHRDIKPSNVFVAPDGHLTVLDLGIALDTAADPLTRTGVVMGTPRYIAPEQATGARVDHRADLFSASVLLSDLLGSAGPGNEVAANAGLPPALKAVVERGLARDPAQRFGTAHELGVALDAAFGEALQPAGAPKRQARRWVGLAVGGVAAMAVTAGAFFWSSPREAPSAPVAEAVAAPSPEPDVEVPAVAEAAEKDRPMAETTQPPAAPARTMPQRPRQVRTPHGAAKARTAPVAPSGGPGHLRVVTQSQGESTWANLTVDGIPRGASPVVVEVPAGHHAVRIERAGFAPVERNVDVQAGASTLLTVEMNP